MEMERAMREQTWTTTEFGLELEEPTQTPQFEMCMVSTIQCQLCATHRIPVLRFCYRCFLSVAVNHIITTTNRGKRIGISAECATRSAIRQHCVQEHVPRDYVDFRYPLHLGELAIITSGDEDKYKDEFDPRILPLRPGILILREQHLWTLTPHQGWNGTPYRTPASTPAGLPYHWILDSVARD